MDEAKQKEIARDFLTLIIKGRIDEAYEKYVNLSGKHHNLFTPAGFAALKEGMKANQDQSPNKQFEVKHLVADGNIIISHGRLTMNPGEKGMVVVHILRFKDGKIVEMWDLGQKLPDQDINSDGAF